MVIVSETVFRKHLEGYLQEVKSIIETEKATEQSFYPVLSKFICNIFNAPDKRVVVNPVEKWGMPDFIVLNGELIQGYIEAKSPNLKIDPFIESEQVLRYKKAFPNVCLTNFFEFIFLGESSQITKIELCSIRELSSKSFEIKLSIVKQLKESFTTFFSFKAKKITDINILTNSLSRLTLIMKDIFISYLAENESGVVFDDEAIESLYAGFKNSLIENISHEEFSDILAQTVCYSLLLAVVHHEGGEEKEEVLTISSIWKEIPQSIPVLVELYTQFMTKMPENVAICCNSIIQLLNNTDMEHVFSFFDDSRIDPTIYFYEKFLEEYNPHLKKIKGVYYTPIQIVSFMVNSVDEILEKKFKIRDGFANPKISVLDPCAGTLTFILQTINCIYGKFANRGDFGTFDALVKEHILKNFYAFEIMVTAYAISHFKLQMFFKSLKNPLGKKDRFKLYLTNTLETKSETSGLSGFFALTNEGRLANKVKAKTPIFVVMGNPPYKIGSTNKQSFIENLMKDYRPRDRKSRENLQPLSDDYIKFIRFAQWKVSQSKEGGMVVFITNNNFLRGRIHRGMRRSLIETFDEIYIHDLHGDAREEKPPIGMRNDNVFNIQTGVCMFFLIKYKDGEFERESKLGFADVYYGDVWGTAKEKLESLSNVRMLQLCNEENFFEKIVPREPFYLLNRHKTSVEESKLWGTFFDFREDIFHIAQIGVQTSRDELSIDYDKELLEKRFDDFFNKNISVNELIKKYELTKWKGNDWTVERITSYVGALRASNKRKEEYLRKIHYRPFDFQYVFYQEGFIQITARERAEHLNGNESGELALVVGRSGRPSKYPWDMAMIVSDLPDQVLVTYRGSSIVCPLHAIREKGEKLSLNIKDNFLNSLRSIYKKEEVEIGSEILQDKETLARTVIYYVYGLLYSNKYREKWQSSLDYDMPRIPVPHSYKLFLEMSHKGQELANLHLLDEKTTSKLDIRNIGFPISGTNKIDRIKYNVKLEHLEVNANQYFTRIEERVWEYRIGGYQVLKQWLRRRKGTEMGLKELNYVKTIVGLIQRTFTLSQDLDDIYQKIEHKIIDKNMFKKKLDHYF